uniref:LRRCT domain-containing protein n=1 Tax=Glossina austeni TaxID=7395 RepID=A0A1A9UYN2_GLOAU
MNNIFTLEPAYNNISMAIRFNSSAIKVQHVFILLINYLYITLTAGITCPTQCKCTWILDSLEVNCAHQELSESPDFGEIPIEVLDLSHNKLEDFPHELSAHERLIYLDLSNNLIKYLEPNALSSFTALRTLLMNNNMITQWSHIYPDEILLNTINLEHLSLNGNQFEFFNDDDSSLMLTSDSLTHLELQGCGISKVGGEILTYALPNLQYLNLNNNSLDSLDELPSSSLLGLELSNCDLQILPEFFISELPMLTFLNLSWNTDLKDEVLKSLKSTTLRRLDLSYCTLDAIDISQVPTLGHLHLQGNMLNFITSKTFQNNSQLEMLDLSRNSLRSIDPEAFIYLRQLTHLDLAYNQLTRLDSNVFRYNEKLVSVNLSRNTIEKFTKLVSSSLRDLSLSWCEIIQIDANALTDLNNLQKLNLLSTLRNTTFESFPELASLKLNGNRFTNPFPSVYFKRNKFLDEIWLGDNPWICNCQDSVFVEFNAYLTRQPSKIRDKRNLKCASPAHYYGKTWESSCGLEWLVDTNENTSTAAKLWTIILSSALIIAALIFLFACFQRYMIYRRKWLNMEEYRGNQEEMRAIRRLNHRILCEEAAPNAPSADETNLPSYEDALHMPKPRLVRSAKSLMDLSSETNRRRKTLRRLLTSPEDGNGELEEDVALNLDLHLRFHSEEMLSNRDRERLVRIEPSRRTERSRSNSIAARHFNKHDNRFPAAYLKAQNLQSAEQIANFQSYENSPYTKRKPKIAEIPPFKRATLKADSVEFFTDNDYETFTSKPNSPFAKRKPKNVKSETTESPLPPAIENYYDKPHGSASNSREGSDFHVIVDPEIRSLKDISSTSSSGSETEVHLLRPKPKKATNASNHDTSKAYRDVYDGSSSDQEPMVLVHNSVRETLF